MSKLCLHSGAYTVERDDVYAVETPEATDSHYPIPHSLLLEEVERNLSDNGFDLVAQSHALSGDNGSRYFGLMEVQRKEQQENSLYNLVIGLRNTHDMTYSAALAMGNRVFVCDNLSFSGEVLIGRRHTKNIARDIPLMIPRAFEALSLERVNMENRIEAYQRTEISNIQANDFLFRSVVDEKIFPISKLPHIVREWRSPQHEEFEPRTVWSLVNAYTEVAKPKEGVRSGNLATLMSRTQKLYGFFDKAIGLSLTSRQEFLKEAVDDSEELVFHNDAFN